jgi:hypothetical protein
MRPRTAEMFELRGLLSHADEQAIGRIDELRPLSPFDSAMLVGCGAIVAG